MHPPFSLSFPFILIAVLHIFYVSTDLLGICRETFSDVTHAEPSSLDMLQICLGAFKRAEVAKEAILGT